MRFILFIVLCCGFAGQNIYGKGISLLPTADQSKFIDPDFYIWGGSMVEGDRGKYHLFYSRWPRKFGHNAWLTHSEIAHAIADRPEGPYKHYSVALGVTDQKHWDGLVTHNPTIHKFGDRYYLYYMGNTGNGEVTTGFNWSHRNNQRIGVAVADSPYGPWERYDQPLIDIGGANDWDALMTSNPSIAQRPDGIFIMVYKAVAKKHPLPGGGPVVHLVATSDSPTGPFSKHPDPIFTKDGEKFPAEDPFIWSQGDKLYAIVKDMKGAFTGKGRSLALFESKLGFHWRLSTHPLVSETKILWESGELQQLAHLERPQLWLKDGKPAILFLAADIDRNHSFNVHVPVKH